MLQSASNQRTCKEIFGTNDSPSNCKQPLFACVTEALAIIWDFFLHYSFKLFDLPKHSEKSETYYC